MRRATNTTRQVKQTCRISIHALLAESDTIVNNIVLMPGEFLSTLSLRRATSAKSTPEEAKRYFYPRSPCGERLIREPTPGRDNEFLSTLSLRRATLGAGKSCDVCRISIHALLAESDRRRGIRRYLGAGFLSTLSLRRATLRVTSKTRSQPNFYPRSPCGERQRT